jgi:hypothetical protein
MAFIIIILCTGEYIFNGLNRHAGTRTSFYKGGKFHSNVPPRRHSEDNRERRVRRVNRERQSFPSVHYLNFQIILIH